MKYKAYKKINSENTNTAAFPQSGSSSAGIRLISASDIGQAASTGEILLLFSISAVGSLKFPALG